MEHAQEATKNSIIDQQRSKRNVKCDENITFSLVGEEIAQMYHVKLQMK
jgi:hypothetical protein